MDDVHFSAIDMFVLSGARSATRDIFIYSNVIYPCQVLGYGHFLTAFVMPMSAECRCFTSVVHREV